MSNLEYLDELSKEFNISKNELVKYIAIVGTNKENIRDYALNVNCAVCRKQNGFIVDYVACMINNKDRKITELKDQLALTEKALELACKEITGSCEYCSYNTMPECPIEANCLDEKINYFKNKAKEMMKNEKKENY
jgi:hypothetical protein